MYIDVDIVNPGHRDIHGIGMISKYWHRKEVSNLQTPLDAWAHLQHIDSALLLNPDLKYICSVKLSGEPAILSTRAFTKASLMCQKVSSHPEV